MFRSLAERAGAPEFLEAFSLHSLCLVLPSILNTGGNREGLCGETCPRTDNISVVLTFPDTFFCRVLIGMKLVGRWKTKLLM